MSKSDPDLDELDECANEFKSKVKKCIAKKLTPSAEKPSFLVRSASSSSAASLHRQALSPEEKPSLLARPKALASGAASLHQAVSDKFKTYFKPKVHSTKFKAVPTPRRPPKPSKPFFKDVIVLKNPLDAETKTKAEKLEYSSEKLFSPAIEFNRDMYSFEVTERIQENIPILKTVEFTYMYECGKGLLELGQSIDGQKLAGMYNQKSTIYLRPSVNLNTVEEVDAKVSIFNFPHPETTTSEPSTSIPPLKMEESPMVQQTENMEEEDDDEMRDALEQSLRDYWDSQHNNILTTHPEPAIQNTTIEQGPATSEMEVSQDSATNKVDKLSELLINHAEEKIPQENVRPLYIMRNEPLASGLRGIRRECFDPQKRIYIKFIDDIGSEEETAIDDGGPRREFFSLVLQELESRSQLFIGEPPKKYLALNVRALNDQTYYYVGFLIGRCLLEGGPTPSFFSEDFFNLVIGKYNAIKGCVNYLPMDVQELIREIEAAETVEHLLNVLSETMLQTCGITYPISSIEQKGSIVSDIMTSVGIHRLIAPMEQFRDGLRVNGLYDKIIKYPDLFQEAFVNCETVNAATVSKVFKTVIRSEKETKPWYTETTVLGWWLLLLEDIEDGKTITNCREVLQFGTGSSNLPAMGFPKSKCPKILFLHGSDSNKPFPQSNTCNMELKLPTMHPTYGDFRDKCVEAFHHCRDFGRQ